MITIALTQGYSTVVSDEDLAISFDGWYCANGRSGPRAVRASYPERKTLLLARCVAERMSGRVLASREAVDHINGDTLDNRRENLRVLSYAENGRNRAGARVDSRSGILGVYPRGKKWGARITRDGEQFYLGTFDTIEEAAAARLKAERELWGIQPRRAEAHAAA